MYPWWILCSWQLWFLKNRQVSVGDSILCCDLLCPQRVTLNFMYPEFSMTVIKGDSILCCDLLCPQRVTLNFRYPEFRMTVIKLKGDSVLDCDLMYHLQLHVSLVDFMYRSRTLHYLNARWHWQWVMMRFRSLLWLVVTFGNVAIDVTSFKHCCFIIIIMNLLGTFTSFRDSNSTHFTT